MKRNETNGTTNGTTPGNGKIGYGPIPGYMQKCAGCGLVIGLPAPAERCACETPMPPGAEWCSPLRAPPEAPHSPSTPPTRCTCPDDSHHLADGSCARCGAPAVAVYQGTPGEALAPTVAEALTELRSIIREEFEALRLEVVKLLGEAVGPDVGPREIEVGPGSGRHIQIVALQARLGRGRTTIRDWYTAKPPKFPVPHYCGALRCWYLREIEAWEEAHRPKVSPPA